MNHTIRLRIQKEEGGRRKGVRIAKALVVPDSLEFNSGLRLDPVAESGHLGVNAGVSLPGAAVAPRHDSCQFAADGQRTAGIALAGVLSSFGHSCTDLSLGKASVALVGFVAGTLGHDGHVHGLQDIRGATALLDSSPSGHRGLHSRNRLFVLIEQRNRFASFVQFEWGLDLKNGDVVLGNSVPVGYVVLVRDYLRDLVQGSSGGFGSGASSNRDRSSRPGRTCNGQL